MSGTLMLPCVHIYVLLTKLAGSTLYQICRPIATYQDHAVTRKSEAHESCLELPLHLCQRLQPGIYGTLACLLL